MSSLLGMLPNPQSTIYDHISSVLSEVTAYRTNSFVPFISALSAYTSSNGTGTYNDMLSAATGASAGAASLQGIISSIVPAADINTTQAVGNPLRTLALCLNS
jgi:hypothetical protein